MALVEHMPQGFLAWTPPAVHNSALEERLKIQNAYIAINVVKRQLNEDGIGWQSSRHNPAMFTHEAIGECGIREVCDIICRSISRVKSVAGEEIEAMVLTLELGDTELYDSYTKVGKNMSEGIGFGRIVTFLCFTSAMCKRLHLDNRQRLIESVVEWLIEYLNDTISPWLESNHDGQWVSPQHQLVYTTASRVFLLVTFHIHCLGLASQLGGVEQNWLIHSQY